MWKREAIVACFSSPTPAQSATSSGDVDPLQKKRPLDDELLAGVGQSILISGELSGDEDLTVQGGVEGKIALRDHVLTVGSHGFFFQAEDGIRVPLVTGVQTCALPI